MNDDVRPCSRLSSLFIDFCSPLVAFSPEQAVRKQKEEEKEKEKQAEASGAGGAGTQIPVLLLARGNWHGLGPGPRWPRDGEVSPRWEGV